MKRRVEAEWLDTLPPEDPAMASSRRDLRWINARMGNAGIFCRVLRPLLRPGLERPLRLVELGAGDGHLMLRVARRLGRAARGTRLTLVDRHPAFTPQMGERFRRLGWEVTAVQADALDWLRQPPGAVPDCEAILANLFVHHFEGRDLEALLSGIAARAPLFIAVEPRRSGLALFFSRFSLVLACNHITRHDAPVSVRAGFTGDELSRCWPADPAWSFQEKGAGRHAHLFVARRGAGTPSYVPA
jgi:hypothetical protein